MNKKLIQLNDTTFNVIPKDDPKDRITVEIGDTKQPDKFYPQVKIGRWGNSEADTDFILTAYIADSTCYKSVDGTIVSRVYQLAL